MLKPLSNTDFHAEVRENGDPIIVLFSASWCQPCKRFKPTVAEMSQKQPDIRFVEMDVEEANDVASEFGIRTVPSLAMFVDGMVREIHSGSMTSNDLRLWIQENI